MPGFHSASRKHGLIVSAECEKIHGSSARVIINSAMNVDFIRRFCLSLPETTESLQWGETLCFKVRGKLFVLLSLDAVPPTICFKTTPERFAELLECEGIVVAPYVGRYKWVLLERLDVLPRHELEELIQQSYEDGAGQSSTKAKERPKRQPKKAAQEAAEEACQTRR